MNLSQSELYKQLTMTVRFTLFFRLERITIMCAKIAELNKTFFPNFQEYCCLRCNAKFQQIIVIDWLSELLHWGKKLNAGKRGRQNDSKEQTKCSMQKWMPSKHYRDVFLQSIINRYAGTHFHEIVIPEYIPRPYFCT